MSNTHFKCPLQALWAQVLRGGGGGVFPSYKSYRYVLPQRAAFLHHFGLKMGIDFTQIGLESGMNIPNK